MSIQIVYQTTSKNYNSLINSLQLNFKKQKIYHHSFSNKFIDSIKYGEDEINHIIIKIEISSLRNVYIYNDWMPVPQDIIEQLK